MSVSIVEPARASGWRLERYRDGDEAAILELFSLAFGRERSLAHWMWKFKRNPCGGPFVSLARRIEDGALIGSMSVMPMMLNLIGKRVLIAQAVDLAVHPDSRGQGVFEGVARHCHRFCQSEGVQAIFGFPNAKSYALFLRLLGWKRILIPTQHIMQLSHRDAFQRVLKTTPLSCLADAVYRLMMRIYLAVRQAFLRLLTADVVFRRSNSVPDGYDLLWNACRSQEVLSIWKDSKYLRWRYDENPDHRFIYFYLSRGEEIVAQAVTVATDDEMTVCELMVPGYDVRLGQRLVNEICRRALWKKLKAVSFFAHDRGFFQEILSGFRHQKLYTVGLCGKTFPQGPLSELFPHADNWTVTYGDTDFI